MKRHPLVMAILLVNPNGSTPYTTIQSAIDAAVKGDSVVLEAGIYTGLGNQDLVFHGHEITVRSFDDEPSDLVVIEPEFGHRAFIFQNNESPGFRLVHLQIQNGDDGRDGLRNHEPGLIYAPSSSPTIQECRFENNLSTVIYLRDSSASVTGCDFDNNSSALNVILCEEGSPAIIGCHFFGNQTGSAITMDDGLIVNCSIGENANVGVYLGSGGIMRGSGVSSESVVGSRAMVVVGGARVSKSSFAADLPAVQVGAGKTPACVIFQDCQFDEEDDLEIISGCARVVTEEHVESNMPLAFAPQTWGKIKTLYR